MSVEFCDTNVLAYASDTTSPAKREAALGLLRRLWAEEKGALSVQVLQELYVTLTRKALPPVPHAEARSRIEELADWRVFVPGSRDVLAAIDSAARWQVSLWDAMILTAAKGLTAEIVWSESLNDGQDYDGVRVRNPFAVSS
jgi:predicted nucleic acid-binding protein